ncbi:uncharacterized protein LOC129962156 [Argiope bruennichi]|uniref:uncharacterized protein LOC129962156 n=1 Tax=Argiope bruennichi TaxID=94029 RepID=UPI0024952DDA|nr:uncharacterized protein LOC129962156 [Argiope bruennichi]
MAFLAKGIKCDLIVLATEMGEEPKSDMTVYGLKTLITGSQVYEEEFVKTLLETIISTRKEQESKSKLQMEMEFELEKKKIEAGMAAANASSASGRQFHINPQIEISKSMPKFDEKECWISALNVTDLEGLKDLIITDQVKKRVPQEVRDHFVDVWGTLVKPQDLADKLDEYECIRKTYRRPSNPNPKGHQQVNVRNNAFSRDNRDYNNSPKQMKQDKGFTRNRCEPKNPPKFTCYFCGVDGHVKKFCPKLLKTNSDQDSRRKANVHKTVVDPEPVTKETAVVAKVMSHRRPSLDKGLCNLEKIRISVNGKPATALIDSGTEITVVRRDILTDFPIEDKASIYIKGIFGPAEKCSLVNIPMGVIVGEDGNMIHQEVLCAVAPTLVDDVLLPPEIRDKLQGVQENYFVDISEKDTELKTIQDREIIDETSDDNPVLGSEEIRALSVENSEKNAKELSRSDEFLKDQVDCPDLEYARKWESVAQLVLPKKRRLEVLNLAHCSVFGGHMGARKTAERIRYSFYWHGISKDVRAFCQQCKECQLTRRINQKDRVPITPVARPELPFQVVNIDIIGPIDPPSAKGHRYILCLVDQHTRWAEAVPLTSLTSKATCEALLTIFMRTGVPNIIASDNGTNFNASLTQEFEKRMGSSPRFSTPLHPESNGLVERFNQTLKHMLHHVILEEPFILWAYREVPNSTTGVAPFQLLYGRKPEGPLSILRNTWVADKEGLQLDTTPVPLYMEKLKKQLEDAAEKAKLISTVQQERMARYYNLRSTKKVFNPGDKVIVLLPDSRNKLLARWQGPCTIESRKNEHSFLVKMPDGSLRHVHQNKMREFIASSGSVNVIFKGEEEFGDIENTPLKEDSFWQEVKSVASPDLSTTQQTELEKLLKEFEPLFKRPVQPVAIEEHVIELLPNITRRKPHSYSVPMSYRAEVDRQVKELLDLHLIEPSNADITYPIVCVAKKDASIRMYITSDGTPSYKLPMSNAKS